METALGILIIIAVMCLLRAIGAWMLNIDEVIKLKKDSLGRTEKKEWKCKFIDKTFSNYFIFALNP